MVVICNSSYPQDSPYETHFDSFPFPLSPFQKHAIEAIVENHHILVTAHTGSGKTLPAEFAIRHWTQKKKKIIYTSPIKALSNQKFYEFSQKFPEVSFGLLTGDIKTNPEADVLIMTTEILMNRLFNENKEKNLFQMDFQEELAAVVFDEIHYINDPDRGQVWEKTILMLPKHVQMIMLSATMDNPERFANWIEENHVKKVYLSSTAHRVVPLSHYGFLTMGEVEYKKTKDKTAQQELRKLANTFIPLQDAKGKFQVEGYLKLAKTKTYLTTNKCFIKRSFVLNQLAKQLRDHDMLPAIGFVFSRKLVEQCAKDLTIPLLEDDSKIPYTVDRECKQIIRRLSNWEEYVQLPEYVELMQLLAKGIGYHHSGMIPILREMVELCISKKYIKFLFATESFAIGLDCPIKTAVFVGLNKFDGNTDRVLHSHEYTQMAGRAGRRGIDTVGHVIHLNNLFALPTQTDYQGIMCGKPPTLISKFKIDYSLVLNICKMADLDPLRDRVIKFITKSMMYNEIHKSLAQQQLQIDAHKETLLVKETSAQYLRSSKDSCIRYIDLESQLSLVTHKKRKELEREMETLKTEHRTILQDIVVLKSIEDCKKTIAKEMCDKDKLGEYIGNQVDQICSLLRGQGLLTEVDTLTEMGIIASHIAEVHGPIWALSLIRWDYFKDFSVKQMVGLFSCATDVKIKEEYKTTIIQTEDPFLQTKVKEMKELYERFDAKEQENNIQTGIAYETAFTYHLIDEAMEWCDCATEQDCRVFLQMKLSEKGISVGDFTKAILKISTISKEFRTLFEMCDVCKEQTEWLYKLTQVEETILKYVATSQSLYV